MKKLLLYVTLFFTLSSVSLISSEASIEQVIEKIKPQLNKIKTELKRRTTIIKKKWTKDDRTYSRYIFGSFFLGKSEQLLNFYINEAQTLSTITESIQSYVEKLIITDINSYNENQKTFNHNQFDQIFISYNDLLLAWEKYLTEVFSKKENISRLTIEMVNQLNTYFNLINKSIDSLKESVRRLNYKQKKQFNIKILNITNLYSNTFFNEFKIKLEENFNILTSIINDFNDFVNKNNILGMRLEHIWTNNDKTFILKTTQQTAKKITSWYNNQKTQITLKTLKNINQKITLNEFFLELENLIAPVLTDSSIENYISICTVILKCLFFHNPDVNEKEEVRSFIKKIIFPIINLKKEFLSYIDQSLRPEAYTKNDIRLNKKIDYTELEIQTLKTLFKNAYNEDL